MIIRRTNAKRIQPSNWIMVKITAQQNHTMCFLMSVKPCIQSSTKAIYMISVRVQATGERLNAAVPHTNLLLSPSINWLCISFLSLEEKKTRKKLQLSELLRLELCKSSTYLMAPLLIHWNKEKKWHPAPIILGLDSEIQHDCGTVNHGKQTLKWCGFKGAFQLSAPGRHWNSALSHTCWECSKACARRWKQARKQANTVQKGP